jgi:hypothetical protein
MLVLFVLSGMEALETAINYWDDALAAYTSGGGGQLAVTSSEEAGFCKELQGLVDAAYRLQDQCELLFLDQVSGAAAVRPRLCLQHKTFADIPANMFKM